MSRLILRVTPYNRYSWTPLLAAVESRGLLDEWDLVLAGDVNSLVEALNAPGPLVVAYSFMTFSLSRVKGELEELKPYLPPHAVLVAGGPHPSGAPRATLGLGFHHVFVGEGEGAFPRFLKGLLKGMDFSPVIVGDRVGLEGSPFFPEGLPYRSPVELTRGCPYGCKYCQVSYLFGFSPRHRPSQDVLAWVRREGGRAFIRFITPDASLYLSRGRERDLKAIEAFLSGLKDAGVEKIFWGTFPSEVRPEGVTPSFLEMVRKFCNNTSLTIGAQSGSEERLYAIGRGHGVEEIRRAARWAREYGLTPHLDFIFGFPGEKDRERRETVDFMEELVSLYGAKIHAHYFMPLPGTPYAHTRPQTLSPWLVKRLGELSRKGVLNGSWQNQAREVGAWV